MTPPAAPTPEQAPFLRDDIRRLGKILGEVIKECEGSAIYDIVETLRRAAVGFRREGNAADREMLERLILGLRDREVNCVARAFTYFLQLSNIAEDRSQNRHQRLQDLGAAQAGPGAACSTRCSSWATMGFPARKYSAT